MDDILYLQMAEIQNKHWWYCARRTILNTLISALPLKKDAEILEIGCGTGVNIKMLQAYGTVSGLEPYPYARETAAKLTGCDIRDGLLPDQIPFSGTFDLIGAFDVIEHIHEDESSLIKIHQSLSPQGYAVFTVPAFRFLWSEHDVANHHKRRYTRKEFLNILQRSGYDVKFISYYNTILFPLVAVVRVIKKISPQTKTQAKADLKMPRHSFVNRILTWIFAIERYWLMHFTFPFGVSIIAICQKKSA